MSRVRKIVYAIFQPSLIRRLFYISVILCFVAVAFSATLPVSALTPPVRAILLISLALAAAGIVGSLTLNLYAMFRQLGHDDVTAKQDGGEHD